MILRCPPTLIYQVLTSILGNFANRSREGGRGGYWHKN